MSYEAARRLEKAVALADVIGWVVRLTLGRNESAAEIAAALDDEGWRLAARKAHVRIPSDATKALTVRILEQRENEARPPSRARAS